MDSFVNTIEDASSEYADISARLLGLYQVRPSQTPSKVSPRELLEGIEQFFGIASQVDRGSAAGDLTDKDITQIGDYGLSMLVDLEAWTRDQKLEDLELRLKKIVLSVADWIMRHGGQIQSLEPVVDALAVAANSTQDQSTLEELTRFMGRVRTACSDAIRNDLERYNPGRPWRILHLNRSIAATRSHNLALMRTVFDELVEILPEDASQFFKQGMHEMDRLNYPGPVRELVQEYFDRYTRAQMH